MLIFNFGLAQNLVPNPSFEEYDTCPTGVSSTGDYQINHCANWYTPSTGTSDYFNSCSPIGGGANVPNNGFGYQNAFDGQGYVGVILLIQEGELSYFEYVQTKLLTPLIQGNKYKFSFNVNLANGSDFAVGSFGAWFTNSASNSSSYQPIFNSLPQIQNASGYISDTTGWTKIEGEFVAIGGEQYLTIGYYSDTLSPDTLRINVSADPSVIYCNINIDYLELTEVVEEIVVPNVITPNGDNVNDVFELPFLPTNTGLYILNRWGEKVFETNDAAVTFWDGTCMGKDATDGIYFYVLDINQVKKTGFIHLIR